MNMQHPTFAMLSRWVCALVICAALFVPRAGTAQSAEETRLADAAELLQAFTESDETAIPADLLQRARGIAIIPNVIRGGFIFGARRGRGVVAVKNSRGEWNNPAFITLTGGSFGWQVGAESTDLVLLFANDNAVKNMSTGKFALGGDASAIAGPLGRRAATHVTFRAEVYGYVRSRGLFAGAAFEGARLNIDEETNARFYGPGSGVHALAAPSSATPASAVRFLSTLGGVAAGAPIPARTAERNAQEAVTFPLD
jgi:lipid-binding SYLF domain-containing protein